VSFDLFFYLNGPARQQGWEPLFAWAEEKRFFERRATNAGGFQLWYENPETGVSFSLAQAHPPPPNAMTHQLAPAYLAFNMNFVRPRFFALEAAPILVDLVTRLGYVVYDPQSGGVGTPTEANIIDGWARGNQQGVGATRAMGQRPPYMDVRSADAFWRYRFDFTCIKEEVSSDAMVPQLVAVARGDAALRIAHLPKPTIYVLPPADMFFLTRNGAPHLVRAEHVYGALGKLFRPLPAFPHVMHIREGDLYEPGVMDAWDRFHATVPVELALSEVKGVAADAFVDV
jgi:hypothetical protein